MGWLGRSLWRGLGGLKPQWGFGGSICSVHAAVGWLSRARAFSSCALWKKPSLYSGLRNNFRLKFGKGKANHSRPWQVLCSQPGLLSPSRLCSTVAGLVPPKPLGARCGHARVPATLQSCDSCSVSTRSLGPNQGVLGRGRESPTPGSAPACCCPAGSLLVTCRRWNQLVAEKRGRIQAAGPS